MRKRKNEAYACNCLSRPLDVRVEQVADAALHEPTDAVVRITHACICGSDVWPYRGQEPFQTGGGWSMNRWEWLKKWDRR
jgi:threonine dehydrogenase-like Zn-dependent dehydrogenase